MVRLGALVLATLAALFLVLSALGDEDLRAGRGRPDAVRPTARDAEAPAITSDYLARVPPPTVIEADAPAPRQVQRFPGPALRPSPEHADARPATPAVSDSAILYVTARRVNVRAGPSTDEEVVAALERGSTVTLIAPPGNEWVNVSLAGGATGFVAARFLSSAAP